MVMVNPGARLGPAARARLRRARQPGWLAPMLATLTDQPFSAEGWIFERKLDGVRMLAFRSGRRVRLLSRNRKERGGSYPEIVRALAAPGGPDLVVDGEVVAFEGGVTSFSRLQRRMQRRAPDGRRPRGVAVYYYVFNLLNLAGYDLTGLALRDRKRLLRRALAFRDPIRFTPHRNREGERFLAAACRKGWEGLIAKRAEAPYVSRRSPDWLKLKCVREQELVIGGYPDPRGRRTGFGALLVGYFERGELRYAGKVGTGYDTDTLSRLGRRLASLAREKTPFADPAALRERGAHWVRPVLVAEIGFTEWTPDRTLRHPRFLGLRDDKDPADVVRERPAGRGP